ncbi:hypothetical protein CDD83_3181 [Cordyceps sp. RAO-2017]|nr:hypothetical protein CDD83_3181 [Cordyceps sp. RAO-2017]
MAAPWPVAAPSVLARLPGKAATPMTCVPRAGGGTGQPSEPAPRAETVERASTCGAAGGRYLGPRGTSTALAAMYLQQSGRAWRAGERGPRFALERTAIAYLPRPIKAAATAYRRRRRRRTHDDAAARRRSGPVQVAARLPACCCGTCLRSERASNLVTPPRPTAKQKARDQTRPPPDRLSHSPRLVPHPAPLRPPFSIPFLYAVRIGKGAVDSRARLTTTPLTPRRPDLAATLARGGTSTSLCARLWICFLSS